MEALSELSPADENGNTLPDSAFALDSRANYVRTKKFTALIGVDNLCVVGNRG